MKGQVGEGIIGIRLQNNSNLMRKGRAVTEGQEIPWWEVAETIGEVLRNRLIQRRKGTLLRKNVPDQNQQYRSLHVVQKSPSKPPTFRKYEDDGTSTFSKVRERLKSQARHRAIHPRQAQFGQMSQSRPRSEQESNRVPSYPPSEPQTPIRPIMITTQSSAVRTMQEDKKREADLLKQHMKRLKTDSQQRSKYIQRQRCYKVWRTRLTNSTTASRNY